MRSTWRAVDDYLEELHQPDAAIVEANAAAERAGLPPIGVSVAQGRFLQLMAQVTGARRALEIGTLAGGSTIWIARGLTGAERHVTTLERDPTHARVATANLARAGLGGVVDVRVGPALDSLEQLAAERVSPYDLVFIDADKPANADYLERSLPLCSPGALIIVDNVVRRGTVADASSTDPAVLGSRAVIDRVATDARLTGTVIQTVGAKGYDGMLLVRVPD